jgi:hypothetical protein
MATGPFQRRFSAPADDHHHSWTEREDDMERRAVRQFGLAAIPVMLLAQCAPQCSPACTPTGDLKPLYTTVGPAPDPPNWTASTDGRYLGVGDPTARLDVDTHERTPTSIGGLLTGDASAVVGLDAGSLHVHRTTTSGSGSWNMMPPPANGASSDPTPAPTPASPASATTPAPAPTEPP